MCKPTYDRQKQMAAEKERERWLWNQAIANRPLDSSAPPRPISAVARRRPASAAAALTAPPGMPALGAPTHSGASGSGPPPAAKPVRPSTARPAKLKRAPSEMDRRAQADASVLKVLDLLSAQRSKITSLKELRAQKDVLMSGVYAAPGDISTELIEAGGIVIHVTSSPACKPGGASSSDQLVVLVHGGLFMSGSPQASAHLAAKLCQQLGVAVATPQLRLAPEHPFPAASDDLKAAYDYLSQYGVDPHRSSPPPTKIALYAESSGGALAVGMLQALKAEGNPLPACVGLVSPWLDLTCEGGSYVVNEAYDLMMRRDRLHGIATAYMAGGKPLSDPRASPLLAPDGPEHFAMPPTLVHVCKNELLLDDALTYGEYCLAQGTDIKVQQFDHALHAWHTYFPLMPVAEQALGEMAAFFKGHLFADAA
jgi:monoterpene epsilon-lactone hydrolase